MRSTHLPGITGRFAKNLPLIVTALLAAAALVGWGGAVLGGLPTGLAAIMDRLSNPASVFLGIFIEALPYLLLGALASGLVEEFISRQELVHWLPRSPLLGAMAGGVLGLFFPVCECGVVPFARRLVRKGMPASSSVATILAAPAVNPIVILSTLTVFGPGLIFWGRVAFSYAIAVLIGVLVSLAAPGDVLRAQPDETLAPPVLSLLVLKKPPLGERLGRVMVTAADEFFDMGRYLVTGGLLAAGLQTFIPQASLLRVGQGPILSVLVMILLAVLLSVCSTVDAFIALAFVGVFSPGAILAFLVFGPMVDIKSTLMFLQMYKSRAVAGLVGLAFVLVAAVSMAVNLVVR